MEQRGNAVQAAEAVDVSDDAADEADPGSHLDDIGDGCGCAEVWEHMSDRRAEE
jgi:hypothetical protein